MRAVVSASRRYRRALRERRQRGHARRRPPVAPPAFLGASPSASGRPMRLRWHLHDGKHRGGRRAPVRKRSASGQYATGFPASARNDPAEQISRTSWLAAAQIWEQAPPGAGAAWRRQSQAQSRSRQTRAAAVSCHKADRPWRRDDPAAPSGLLIPPKQCPCLASRRGRVRPPRRSTVRMPGDRPDPLDRHSQTCCRRLRAAAAPCRRRSGIAADRRPKWPGLALRGQAGLQSTAQRCRLASCAP